MPLNITTGKMVCGGCGAECDYVEALPKDDHGRLSGGSPVSTTHEFIHANCPHPNNDDGTWHEAHDHQAVLADVRQRNRRVTDKGVSVGDDKAEGDFDFPPDPVKPGVAEPDASEES